MALLGPGPGWSRSQGRGPLALLTRTLLVSAEGAGGGSRGGPPSVQSPPTGAIRPRARWPQAAHRPPRVPSDPVPFSPLLSHPRGDFTEPQKPQNAVGQHQNPTPTPWCVPWSLATSLGHFPSIFQFLQIRPALCPGAMGAAEATRAAFGEGQGGRKLGGVGYASQIGAITPLALFHEAPALSDVGRKTQITAHERRPDGNPG